KKAAVLVPFCNVNRVPSVLFTVRSLNLSNHSGQVSFPGGMYDETDLTIFETALRESEEEIGLDRNRIHILGELAPMPSRNFETLVTPVIAFCSDIEIESLKINYTEVLEVFSCSLESLMLKTNWAYTTFNTNSVIYKLPVCLNQKHKIWGLTALVLHQTLHISFPQHFPFNFRLLKYY
ncbi:hypothetical protein HELRODRAFT_63763, partial [Helobdella robusta]|uniref:Nudix hydrolase domain-containing protein n=1 Tax=Helobdella robusta TaxID=6412 RepID=T1FXK0_HELRO